MRQWVASAAGPREMADRFFWQLAGDPQLAGVLETWRSAGATEDIFWTASAANEHKAAYAKTSGQQDQLWSRHVLDPRSLIRLASNPFMLTMLFQVWVDGRQVLPQNRGDLFGRFIACLFSREELTEVEATRLLSGLAGLAWRMQREKAEGDGFGVLTVVSRDTVVEALGGDTVLFKKALDTTLLDGVSELRFRHQLLQEYFTAQALQSRLGQTSAAELWPAGQWWKRTGWEETAVLLAGLHSDDCTAVIRWLADAQPEVAAQCIEESGAEIGGKPALLAELQAAWRARLDGERREALPESRAAVGRALGRLKLDTRKGVGLRPDGLPDIDWVEIPAGEFIYQEEKSRRKIGRFFIARYPVTNWQYQAFLEAEDGYRDDRWWKDFTSPDRTPGIPAWTEWNHPRESVGWHEAMTELRQIIDSTKVLDGLIDGRFYWAPFLSIISHCVAPNVQVTSLDGSISEADHSVAVTLEGVAAAREPRAAAEDLRQLLIEQLDKNYSSAKVTFKNLEDLDTLVNLSGVPTASARFVLSITLDPKPADPAKANEPAKEIAKPK